MKRIQGELGALERRVMQLVWAHGPITADSVRSRLDSDLKEVTVRTVLRRLEEKGYVAHTVDNRTFVYSATETRERAAARAVKRVVDWFCDGSVDEVLVGMVEAEMLDRSQLDKLAKRIEQAKKARKSRVG
jgi:BlaI family transcriptional regulator, penicillinase repressor